MPTDIINPAQVDPYSQGYASGRDPLSFFLGNSISPGREDPYGGRPTTTFTGADAGKMHTRYLGDTIVDYTMTGLESFWTTRIMPWFMTNDTHFTWRTWEHFASFLKATPHLAAASLITQGVRTHSAVITRYALAIAYEANWVQTQVGRARFASGIWQIANATAETAHFEILRALLGCRVGQLQYQIDHNVIEAGDLDGYWNRIIERWMCAQKSFGLETLADAVNADMAKTGAHANAWILPEEIVRYVIINRPEKNTYALGGQQAVDRINGVLLAGTDGPSIGTHTVSTTEPISAMNNGDAIFYAHAFHVGKRPALNLLARQTEIGVFNTFILQMRDLTNYTTESMDKRVYDNRLDTWGVIRLEDAVKHCVLFDSTEEGRLLPLPPSQGIDNTMIGHEENDFLFAYNEGNERKRVYYIGDLRKEYFTVKDALNGGQTIYNQLHRYKPGDNATAAQTKDFTDRSKALVGENSLFFGNPRPGSVPSADTTQLWKAFSGTAADKAQQYATIRKTHAEGDDAPGVAPGTEHLASIIQSDPNVKAALDAKYAYLLNNTAVEPLMTTSKSAEAKAIAADSSKTFEERCDQLCDIAKELVARGEMTSFASPARAEEWYGDIASKIDHAKVQSDIIKQVRGTSAIQPSTKQWPVDQPLPSGYDYLNAEEREKARAASQRTGIPTGLSDLTWMSHLFVQSQAPVQQGQRGRQFIGAGMGAETVRRLNSRYTRMNELAEAISKANVDDDLKYYAYLYIGAEVSRKRFMIFCEEDIVLPIDFLAMRAHALYTTRSAIKCAMDGACGVTAIGQPLTMYGSDSARQAGHLQFSICLSAFCTRPEWVYVQDDIACAGYHGGMDTTFWTRDEYVKFRGSNRQRKSILVTALPRHMKNPLDVKIDIRGRWITEKGLRLVGEERFKEWCYPGAFYTSAVLGLGVRQKREITTNGKYSVRPNTVCWQAVQFSRGKDSDKWVNPVREMGHHGPYVYPGIGIVRNGGNDIIRPEQATYLGK